MSLCMFADTFGKTGEGVHSIRIFDIAVIDVLFTFLAVYFFDLYINKSTKNVFKHFLILLVASIFIHKLFCVDTKLTNMFFD